MLSAHIFTKNLPHTVMPRHRNFAQLAVLFVLCASLLYAEGTTITILHVNDTHSHLDTFGPKDLHLDGTIGGIAKTSTVIEKIRASEAHVIVLHAGDVFHGDFFFNKFFGAPELRLLNTMGFDAMAVGNHEFDLGPDLFANSLKEAFGTPEKGFPILSANLTVPATATLKDWVQPGVVIRKGGFTFGIFGMTIPEVPTAMPAPVIIRDDIVPAASEAIEDLKSRGARIIICLSHLGIQRDQVLAAAVEGVDFIIGGHDQITLDQPITVTNPAGKPTLIFQAGEFYKYVGKLTIRVDNGTASMLEYKLLPVDRRVKEDPKIQAVVNGLKEEIVKQYGDVYHERVGVALRELSRNYDKKSPLRDTPLGNLITDACRMKGGTDISIATLGFISERIYAGAIVGADVFRAVSYGFDPATGLGFKLVKLQMTGTDLVTGLETSLAFLGQNDDYFLQLSGMKYTYDASKPIGSRVIVKSIRVNDKPFEPTTSYTVTVNEGIAALLPTMGVQATVLNVLQDFEYTVVKDYIHHLGNVNYVPEGRIEDLSVKGTH